MGLGTWIKDKLLGGDDIQRREEVQRQLQQATSPTQPISRAKPAHNYAHDQTKRCDSNPNPNWQVSKDPTRYSGTRVNRDNCICGCWGKSLNELSHGVVDLSLYSRCPARRARKQKERQARAVDRECELAKKRVVTEKRKVAQKAQAKADKQNRTLKPWNTRHQTGEPARSAAEAKYRDLSIYQGKACKQGHFGERQARNGECVECKLHDARLRGAMRRGAYPHDLTQADRDAIAAIYKEARKTTRETGIEHHVDHIKPLVAGGTHHPNNLQILTAEENLKKGATWENRNHSAQRARSSAKS